MSAALLPCMQTMSIPAVFVIIGDKLRKTPLNDSLAIPAEQFGGSEIHFNDKAFRVEGEIKVDPIVQTINCLI